MSTQESPSLASIQALLDKQAIYENMMLYIRGQDRKDLDLMKSTFWPDATEHHGAFIGTGHDFCDWAYETHKVTQHRALHHCGNTLIELDGHRAKRETVFMYVRIEETRTTILSGRYRDLCEKRGDEWKVLRRVVISDWAQELGPNADYKELFGHLPSAHFGAPFPQDSIYGDWDEL